MKILKMWAAGDLLPDVLDCYRTRKDAAFALRNDGKKRKPVRVLILPITDSRGMTYEEKRLTDDYFMSLFKRPTP